MVPLALTDHPVVALLSLVGLTAFATVYCSDPNESPPGSPLESTPINTRLVFLPVVRLVVPLAQTRRVTVSLVVRLDIRLFL